MKEMISKYINWQTSKEIQKEQQKSSCNPVVQGGILSRKELTKKVR